MRTVIDTDPGVDDALALLSLPDRIELECLVASPGNVETSSSVRNTAFLRDRAFPGVPVLRGADSPLERELRTSESHGETGLGELEPGERTADGDAVGRLLSMEKDDVSLVVLGPPTTVAEALEDDPRLLEKFRSVTLMGGACRQEGNVTETAEFNFWCDPEAADRVLRAPGEKRLVPLDVCREVRIDPGVIRSTDFLEKLTGPYSRYYRREEGRGPVMYDPVAVLLASDPSLGSTEKSGLKARREGERGELVQDPGRPETEVFTGIDEGEAGEKFKTGLKSGPETGYVRCTK
ncbi:MAG: nucleoside hydrolase [Candidatus Nanohaloarchaea archaeon]